MRRFAAALGGTLLFFLGGCGGGSSPPPAPILQSADFGTVRPDAPTDRSVDVKNPLPEEAAVELMAAPTGPFMPVAGELPGVVSLDSSFRLELTLTPGGDGVQNGMIRLKFTSAAKQESREVDLSLTATAETPMLSVDVTSVDFGAVAIGSSDSRMIHLTNLSEVTPITIQNVLGLPQGFTLPSPVFPRTVSPGSSVPVTLTYKPTSLDSPSFDLLFSNSVTPDSVTVHVTANTSRWAPRIVTDFGTVPVTGGMTDWMYVDVSPDAISLTVEGLGPTSAVLGLSGLEGPGGKVYENSSFTGDYFWNPGQEVFSATVPNTDRANLQLVAGGGTYRFRIVVLSGAVSTLHLRAITLNRPGGTVSSGTLDLNVFLTEGIGVSAAAAPNDPKMMGLLSEMDHIYSQVGIRLGKVTYYDLADPVYDNITTNQQFADLLSQSSMASETRLNLFMVQTAFGGGVVGTAGTIDGPYRNGTVVSGVMIDYDFSGAKTEGYVSAHECGHYLGLYHTVEQNGSHDFIDDTVECPPTGTSTACPTPGNGYLMHWQVLSVDPVITPGQGRVLLGHPFMNETGGQTLESLHLPPPPEGALEELPPNWCGTCALLHFKSR